ncbi:activator of Hsp90 ATPase-like protein [Kribbella voronezhensis]|uniref:Activator of Hsp90 ATPase-like protein n=1 Tax=Kribbella voronezhensis TaxID=2512212 RepID=A0A4R7T505_9ACTN|nr:SRPBCC domain-containing protein [Kribbella voronezhensis]TDU86715.1 activator of Hsp90 ATPase-like protein [Kribbella voronezhensis]
MSDILHRIATRTTSADGVYEALTTIDGLAGWWTKDTTGKTGIGDVIEFRFPPGGFSLKVLELVPGELVRWEVVEGPEEWVGTTVNWKLEQSGDYTVVLFEHLGWKEPVEFMYHCSTKWASYLLSLKSLVETGTGAPSPHDVMISDWH